MKTSLKLVSLVGSVIGIQAIGAAPAFAGGLYVQESLIPIYHKNNPVPADPTVPLAAQSGFGYDARTTVGYKLLPNVMLGASLNLKNDPLNQDAIAGPGAQNAMSSSTKYLEFGPSLGYIQGGFHGIVTYIVAGNRTYTDKETDASGAVKVDMNTVDAISSGVQLDVGYTFQISPSVGIGPSLLYRNVSYKNQTLTDNLNPAKNTSNQSFVSNPVDASITPMITLSIGF